MDYSAIINRKDRWWVIPLVVASVLDLPVAALVQSWWVHDPVQSVENKTVQNQEAKDNGARPEKERQDRPDNAIAHATAKPVVVDAPATAATLPDSVLSAHARTIEDSRFVAHGDGFRLLPSQDVRHVTTGEGWWLVSALEVKWVAKTPPIETPNGTYY